MKLSPEKETFMTDLISGCIKSFSLISFNQMSWSMNKKYILEKKDEIYDEHILTAVQ